MSEARTDSRELKARDGRVSLSCVRNSEGTWKVRYYESLGSEGLGPERDGQRQGVGRRRRSRAVQK